MAILAAIGANGLSYVCAEKSDAEDKFWVGAAYKLCGIAIVVAGGIVGLFFGGLRWIGTYVASLMIFMFATVWLEDRASKRQAEKKLFQSVYEELWATDPEFYDDLAECREFRDEVFSAMRECHDCWTTVVGDDGKTMYYMDTRGKKIFLDEVRGIAETFRVHRI